MARVLDFAYGRPSPASIKAAGYVGVVRYLCQDTEKRLTVAEVSSYHGAGLGIGVVYEDGSEDALGGANAGTAHAKVASPQLEALKIPARRPLYFAVDFQIQPQDYALAWECISVFARCLNRPAAAYGPRPFLAYCAGHGCQYLWETGASSWDTGPVPPCLRLRQGATSVTVDGFECDYDETLTEDWGQFPAPVVPVPKPAPKPAPPPHVEPKPQPKPAPVPAPPAPTPPEEDVHVHAISITTDANGDGFHECVDFPWDTFVAVSHEGTRSAGHYATGQVHAAPSLHDKVALSVTGSAKNGTAVVLLTATM